MNKLVESGILVKMREHRFYRDHSLGVCFNSTSEPFKVSKRRFARDASLKDSDRMFERVTPASPVDDEPTESE